MGTRESLVIVGGGQAGAWAAKTLRQQGFDGRLTLVGAEAHPPYERPPLSKQLLLGQSEIEAAYVFPPQSYEDWGVELRLHTTVESLAPTRSRIVFGDKEEMPYDKLLLATGGRPCKLQLTGAELPNVFYLRSVNDALALRKALTAPARVLVLGGGWIGLEVAAAARKLGAAVTVVEAASRLCARAAPPEVSKLLLELHCSHEVDIRLNTTVTTLEGHGRVERAQLSDGQTLDITAVVIGVGIVPVTDLAEAAGLAVDNGIVANSNLQTSIASIYAAGDVANFRDGYGRRTRLESWDNAQRQGIAAGKAMLGQTIAMDRYPWFWSDQYGQNVQMVGSVIESEDRVELPATNASRIILYLRGAQVTGAVGINAGRDIRLIKRQLESGPPIDAYAIAKSGLPLQEAIKI